MHDMDLPERASLSLITVDCKIDLVERKTCYMLKWTYFKQDTKSKANIWPFHITFYQDVFFGQLSLSKVWWKFVKILRRNTCEYSLYTHPFIYSEVFNIQNHFCFAQWVSFLSRDNIWTDPA